MKPTPEMAWPIYTDDQVEALARECDWDNRKYMTPKDYAIWCERMRKFARLAAPSAPDGWQPIETAPKDGTKILLCLTGYQPVVGYFDGHRWDYQDREDFIEEDHWFAWQEQTGDWYPDHWMPIPAPPAIRSETP